MSPPRRRVDARARGRLLTWYRKGRRDLPWRRTSDPYAVWVSEVMLQQTRVQAAVPFFERWMRRFPSLADLAHASEEDVLAAWSGLGYYSRARSLHKAAKVVMAQGGQVPSTAARLRELPGIGPYTAGAIASIAFGEAVPAVDGNVVRVACRIAGIRDPSRSPARRRVEELAMSWVPQKGAGDWNQAVMELGATVCVPKAPRCDACPVASACEARRAGDAHLVPVPRKRPQAPVQRMQFAAVVQDGALLLVRNPAGLLAGLWSLPGGPVGTPLQAQVKAQTGITIRPGRTASEVRHTFTHRVWDMQVRKATVGKTRDSSARNQAADPTRQSLQGPTERDGGGTTLGGRGQAVRESHLSGTWMPISQLSEAALSIAMRAALRAVSIGEETAPKALA